jgi:hypothetical protein
LEISQDALDILAKWVEQMKNSDEILNLRSSQLDLLYKLARPKLEGLQEEAIAAEEESSEGGYDLLED